MKLETNKAFVIRYIRSGYTNEHLAEHYEVSLSSVERYRKKLRDEGVDLTPLKEAKKECIPKLATIEHTDRNAIMERRKEYIKDLNNTCGDDITMMEMTLYKAIVYEINEGVSATKIMERYKVDAETIELGYRIVANEKAKQEIRSLLAKA